MGLSKKNRYVYCYECGCRLEMNGVCKICGHIDVPLLPGMVPDVIGLSQAAAEALITGPEAQLTVGNVTTANHETIEAGKTISSDPIAGTQKPIGSSVDLVISDGPGT